VVTEPSRLSPAQVQGTFAALEEVGDMGSRLKQATVLTVVAATFASAMYGIALAHTPHVPQVSVTWDAWHLTGTVAAVSHSAETYSSYSRASWSHTHTFFAKIEWLDDHGLFWDTHGVKTATNTGTYAKTATLSFTATRCRRYKFIGAFRNDSHGSPERSIDEADGVQPFYAGC